MRKPDQRGRIVCDARVGPAANARCLLPRAVAAFFAQVRNQLARNPAPPDLHPLRLAAKRLRYTLELFRPCYGPGLDARLEALRNLQTSLGEVNDSSVVARMLAQSMEPSPRRERVLAFLERRAAQKALEFRKHWAGTFDVPGQELWWTSYLARKAHAPRRK